MTAALVRYASPRRCTLEDFEADALASISVFVTNRGGSLNPYPGLLEESLKVVSRVFAVSNDLRNMSGTSMWTRELVDAARFLGGQPISADDLKTVVGFTHPGVTGEVRTSAQLDVIVRTLDVSRFPWMPAHRAPTEDELRQAIYSTSVLRAVERTRTFLRMEAGRLQEQEVVACLASYGVEELTLGKKDPRRDDPDLLQPGQCVHGLKLWGKQCDVLMRLYDKRFLAIECKASNSAVNSLKRVNDVSDKAAQWRLHRGEQVVTAAVLSGVHTPTVLEEAQDKKHVSIFWEHNLQPLLDFVGATAEER